MDYRYITLLAIAAVAAVQTSLADSRTLATMKSPDGKTTLTVTHTDGSVNYSLTRGGETLVAQSPIGINTSLADFSTGLTVGSVDEKKIDTSYTLPIAGQSRIADLCNQLTVNVDKDGNAAQFLFRIYNEGMAWRYIIPGQGSVTVTDELGAAQLPAQTSILSQPLCQGTRGSFAEADPELLECMRVASLPLMATSGNNQIILAETAPAANYCGSRLTIGADGSYVFSPIETVEATLPLSTPWRMVIAADATTFAASHMAESLADPTTISDMSWIIPGRAASAFAGEDHTASYLDMTNIRSYIDWASRQGWEYFTLDQSWATNGISLKDVVSYAKSKNVGVFVWLSRHSLPTADGQMRTALQTYKTAGVKGVKVDFWEDDRQATVAQRNTLLKIAAEKQLMVILANTLNTAGLNRTWPNLMATESGLNNSLYAFTPDMVSATHNINTAILKAPFGPVNYYPVDFAEHSGKLLQSTTHAHQLALSVIFQSGVQHLADAPANLRYSMAKEILRTLPATWDETLCTEAATGSHITMVRRNADDRYIAALTAEPRTATVKLDFLPAGTTVNAYIYRDGTCPTDIAFEYREGLTAASEITLPLAENGGALVKLTPSSEETKPYCVRYEAEAPANTIPFGVSVLTDPAGLCSGNEFVAGAGNGRTLFINNISVPAAGTYAVTVYYMASEASSGYLKLNGELASIRALNFINSGGADGHSLAQATVSLNFTKTSGNSLEINSSESLPGIDRITVTDNESSLAAIDNVAADPEMAGRIYATAGAVVIEQPAEASYTIHNTLGRQLAAGHMDEGTVTVPISETGIVIVSLTTPTARFSQKLVVR